MSNHLYKPVIIFVVAALLLVSCGAKPTVAVPTATQMSPDAIFTAAAQTAEARRILTATAMVTPTPLEPTATFTPPVTDTPQATITCAPTTPLPTATSPAVSSGADNAVWVQDVTIPDGTDFNSGTAFTKTWRIANKGATTWTTSYKLVHVSGDALGAKESVAMTIEVAPNATVDVSVDMVAPAANGNYKSFWRMQNAAGTYFGDAIYVDIDVVNGAVSTAQPTTTGQATATATQGSSGGGTVSGLTITLNDDTVTSECPHEFAVTASFTLSEEATVTYKFDAGTETPGFSFDLPGENTVTLSAGSHTLTFSLNIANSGSGWIKLHITAPTDAVSNQANFSLTCQN